jgi:type IV secretion system protein VirD4
MMVLAAMGTSLAAVFFPVPLASWFSIVVPAEHRAHAGLLIVQAAKAWVHTRGYLPWRAWAVLARHPQGLLAWLVLTLAWAGLWAYMGRDRRGGISTWGGPPPAGKGQHGTAHWRQPADLGKGFSEWRSPKKDRPQPANPSGILVGQAGPERAWVLSRDEHVLLIGSTGSRKSRGIILPTIGVIGAAGKESMILTDPKGQLYAHSAAWLRSIGYGVVRFDLREPALGNRWNPVATVAGALAQGRTDHASARAREIAHVITYSQEYTGTDPIWPQSQETLITALILAVAQGQPPPGGLKLREPDWVWPAGEQKHMGSVYASLLAGGPGGGRVDAWLHHFPPHHPAFEAYGPVCLSVEKTRASILTGAAAQLSLWSDTEIKWLTADQDHDLAGPGKRPTAVFLVIPDDRGARYPLATLYVQQTLQALVQLADENGGRLPVNCNFLLDEFGNLPQIRDFDHTVTVARGRGIRLLLAVQDLAQLKRHYADATQTIKGNCNTWIYLLTADIDTAKEISAKCGQYTTAGETYSMPKVYWTSSTVPGHATNTTTLVGRPLVEPDELLRWPEFQALVLQARHAPARLPLPDLSAWSATWPEIQEPTVWPQPEPMEPVPVWRPPLPPEQASPPEPAARPKESRPKQQRLSIKGGL